MTMIERKSLQTRTDALVLVAFCGFLFFYGLGSFGLLGADEPRYAQIAREMLNRSDWVTPILLGKPWLEKPVLYYWQAMISFRLAGVSDQAARLPAAFDASLLILGIYFFLRRFRPGSELDGALIAASCVGVIGFAHAAATDMPLAATFGIALLAWYAWYESGRRGYLLLSYIFLALGTLAKGPVAPALAGAIVFLFAAVKRDWRVLVRSLWLPGLAAYLIVALPWYVAVQLRNPEFFRFFILEHNLTRFSQDVYHHRQPFWYYLPIFLLAVTPWAVLLIAAVGERLRLIWNEGKEAFTSSDDSWALFLLLWMFVPILFFSASQSKLPGYILPAVPAGALLVADHLAGRRNMALDGQSTANGKRFSSPFAIAHGALCGLLIFAAFSVAKVIISHRLRFESGTYTTGAIAAVVAIGIAVTLLSRAGLRLLRPLTLFVVVVGIAVVIRTAAPVIDATQSARPIAESIESFSHDPVPVALFHVSRVQEYGLEFYLNRSTPKYEDGIVPASEHVVVAPQGSQSQVAQLTPGLRVSYLTSIPAQKLELYWVEK